MDLIDLLIGIGAFGASLVLIVLLLVQGSAVLATILSEDGAETGLAD